MRKVAGEDCLCSYLSKVITAVTVGNTGISREQINSDTGISMERINGGCWEHWDPTLLTYLA